MVNTQSGCFLVERPHYEPQSIWIANGIVAATSPAIEYLIGWTIGQLQAWAVNRNLVLTEV
jgi:hypothetical protein